MKNLLVVLPLFLLFTGCSQSPAPGDSSAVTSRSEAWLAALNAGDLDALVGIYEEDARMLAPNRPMARGADAVRAEFGAMIDAGLSAEAASVEATVYGDIGYNIGTYSIIADGTVVDTGKFIETWHRGDDGQWRISNDIYNSDLPVVADPAGHLIITHEVDDADHWMAAWRGDGSRHDLFKANGATDVRTFRSADYPNLTGLVVGVSDMEALNAMLDSEEGRAAAAEDGVRMNTLTVLGEAK